MRLTDKAVKAAKPQEKPYRLFDGDGLYLDIRPNGSKYWRMKCSYEGREVRLAFGVYPKVALVEARQKRDQAHAALAKGKDPRYPVRRDDNLSFEKVAKEWFETQKGGWTPAYANTVWRRLEMDAFPRLGTKDVRRVDAQDVLGVIRTIDARGAPVKAKRVLRVINAIFAYVIITIGEIPSNPAAGLHIAIKNRPVEHNPYLKEKELPEFLKRLDKYSGDRTVALATQFLLLTMTRTGETRFARFDEIDWKEKIWKIPEQRMKMRRTHWVPLSRQAIAILKEAKESGSDFIFPSPIRRGKPLSENAILYAIYDLGYRGRLTGHGFRATASTILNERGHNSLAIERQLAHVDRNAVRASYNHAEFLNERRAILQAWADLLDDLRNS